MLLSVRVIYDISSKQVAVIDGEMQMKKGFTEKQLKTFNITMAFDQKRFFCIAVG